MLHLSSLYVKLSKFFFLRDLAFATILTEIVPHDFSVAATSTFTTHYLLTVPICHKLYGLPQNSSIHKQANLIHTLPLVHLHLLTVWRYTNLSLFLLLY